MNKWEKILPDGLSKCLGQYFEKNYLWSPKRDPRFRHQNQARRCFVEFVDYQKCLKAKSEKECEYFKFSTTAICPGQWIEKWNEQLENGSFPVKL